MDADFQDFNDQSSDGDIGIPSSLFFRSHRNATHAHLTMDEELTPWEDSAPLKSYPSDYQGNLSKQRSETKKRKVSENAASFRSIRKREKAAAFQSTKLILEDNKDIENSEETPNDGFQQSYHKASILSPILSPDSAKSRNILNLVFNAKGYENRIHPPLRQGLFQGSNIAKKPNPEPQYVPTYTFPALAMEFKRGFLIQKQMASRTNKFLLNQSKLTNDEVSIRDLEQLLNGVSGYLKEKTRGPVEKPLTTSVEKSPTNAAEKVEALAGGEAALQPIESFRQALLSRKESRKVETFEAKPLNGVKTELNDFRKKLSAFGLYNFGKKNKPETKLEKNKSEILVLNESANTDVKLKLEILRKLNKDGQESPKVKAREPRNRDQLEKQFRLFVGPTKKNIEDEPSYDPTAENSLDQLKDIMMLPSPPAGNDKAYLFDLHKRLQSEGDVDTALLELKTKLEQNRSLESIRVPLQVGDPKKARSPEPLQVVNSRKQRNISAEKNMKMQESTNLLQSYLAADGKLINMPLDPGRTTLHSSKMASQQEKAPIRKWPRNRKYTKCSLNYQDVVPLKEVLKIGGIEKS